MNNPFFISRIEYKLSSPGETLNHRVPLPMRFLKPILIVLFIIISTTIGFIVGTSGRQDNSSSANQGTSVSEIASQYQLNLSQEEILENYYTAN